MRTQIRRITMTGPTRNIALRGFVLAICACVAALGLGREVRTATHGDETIRVQSLYAFDDTVLRLREALESRNLRIFAVVDHRAAAQTVGMEMPPTMVLIYGNPKGGTPLMLAAPDFSLELPLKVLVREEMGGRTYVTFNPSSTLEGKHGLAFGMTKPLAAAEDLIINSVSAITDTQTKPK
jgi:uncharacterized protein (DUF302 family)